jgi:hypothetical protein
MSDPRRFLDDAALLSTDERRALEAGKSARPPLDAKRNVLSAVLAGLPNGGAAGPGGGASGGAGAGAGVGAAASAAGAGGALALVKPAVIGVALGLTAMGGFMALRPAEPLGASGVPTPVEVPSPPLSARPPAGSAPPALVVDPEPKKSEAPAPPRVRADSDQTADTPEPPRGPSVSAFPDGQERLDGGATGAGESRAVAEARALLRGGNPTAALAALERLREKYPNGSLVQEREALAIEALLEKGDRAGARSRAADFLARYPKSPHATAARRALE